MKETFEKARLLAVRVHGEQKYGDEPYVFHLEKVVRVLERFGFGLDDRDAAHLLVSAWLHDSLEDTSLTKAEIESDFGPEIADIVWRVTDEEGANRKERKAKTYLKIRESEKAILLKLADRIANVESCLATDGNLLQMYRREQGVFADSLKPFTKTEKAFEMWRYLEGKLNHE